MMRNRSIFLTIIIVFALCLPKAHAQQEGVSDSIRYSGIGNIKNYDGFLLDMGSILPLPVQMPHFSLASPYTNKYSVPTFTLDTNTLYSKKNYYFSSPNGSMLWGSSWLSPLGNSISPTNMQMGSFLLRNGMRINTYGEYNKEGWRVPNPSTLPWERNNFKGAFELKSSNGSFGVRIEVQRGGRTGY